MHDPKISVRWAQAGAAAALVFGFAVWLDQPLYVALASAAALVGFGTYVVRARQDYRQAPAPKSAKGHIQDILLPTLLMLAVICVSIAYFKK